MVGGGRRHLSTIVVPYPIHQEEFVTLLEPQHADGVGTLISRQR